MALTFGGSHLRGNHASRPAANTLVEGALYYCTDHHKVYRGTGPTNTWSDYTEALATAADLAAVSANAAPEICCGRLTLESGVAVSTTDQTGKTTVYFTPYKGNRIALFDLAAWDTLTFAETSLALGTLTSGKNYDVFGYDNGGTFALELSAAWTNDTTRADALAVQDGVLCKSGALTRRYLGTFRTTSTTTTEDSAGGTTTNVGGKRFLWNYYNRVERDFGVIDTANSWTYTTNTWRQANGNAGNKVEFVVGVNEDAVRAVGVAVAFVQNNSTRSARASIVLDSTTVPGKVVGGGFITTGPGIFTSMPLAFTGRAGIGYHYLAWVEAGADGTSNFIGDNAGGGEQSGFYGTLFG